MNRYRILLADDEQIERMALAKRLVKHFGDSLAISEAVNGAEALKVFKREQSQIVLMDISMPEMNGAEAVSYTHLYASQTEAQQGYFHEDSE